MEIKTINEWKIDVSSNGVFTARKEGETNITANNMEDIKKEIERLRKASAKRLPFWEINKGWGFHNKIEGEITSLKEKERGYGSSFEVWYSKKSNEGRNSTGKFWSFPVDLIKPTESNEKTMKRYIELKKKKESLETQMKELKFNMYSKKEIIENFGFKSEK